MTDAIRIGGLVCYENVGGMLGIVFGECHGTHGDITTHGFKHSQETCILIMWEDGIIGHFPYTGDDCIIIVQ
jgi:hypothetical protein